MNGLIRKMVKAIGFKWLTGQVRAAAEGKLGPKWQAAYWWLAGRKRVISLLLGAFAGTTAVAGYTEAASIIGGIATLGLALGFVDANWRTEAEADWLKDSWGWKLLANNAPVLTTGLVAAVGWLQGTTCTLGGAWCSHLAVAAGLLGALLVQVGVLDAAWNTAPPAIGEAPKP